MQAATRKEEFNFTFNELVKSISTGSIAGMNGKLVEYPFDTIKVRLQATPGIYAGPWDCFIKILKHEGFFTLYKGMSSPMIGTILESALSFTTYGYLKKKLKEIHQTTDVPLQKLFIAGSITGIISALFNTPLELIKCRLQVANSKYNGPAQVVREIIQKDGISGIYRGLASTVLREVPGTAFWFSTYEASARITDPYLKNTVFSFVGPIIGGALAGCMYWTVPYPIDSIKSRIQTYTEKRTIMSIFTEIMQKEGIRGFYNGLGVTLLRAAPTNAVLWLSYEYFSQVYDKYIILSQ